MLEIQAWNACSGRRVIIFVEFLRFPSLQNYSVLTKVRGNFPYLSVFEHGHPNLRGLASNNSHAEDELNRSAYNLPLLTKFSTFFPKKLHFEPFSVGKFLFMVKFRKIPVSGPPKSICRMIFVKKLPFRTIFVNLIFLWLSSMTHFFVS